MDLFFTYCMKDDEIPNLGVLLKYSSGSQVSPLCGSDNSFTGIPKGHQKTQILTL